MECQHHVYMIIATYAKAAGLSRDEATILWHALQTRGIPMNVDEAYGQLDDATQRVRRLREHEDY